ncbi:TilS substrate-binding domain-containing protein [Coxiella-like endosymbiont]|nr:TilS substrate-binding domain-containing protein [Coxiella-like endosymbiont]
MKTKEALAIKPLLQLTPEQQRNILRRWMYRLGFSVPQTKQLEQIRSDVLKASEDAAPLLFMVAPKFGGTITHFIYQQLLQSMMRI